MWRENANHRLPCPTHQATDTSESESDDPPPLGAILFFRKESVGKYPTLRSIDLVILKRMFVGKLVSLNTITYPFQIWIASFPKLGMMWILTWSELGLKICRFRRHSEVVRPPWQYLFIQRNSMKSLLSRRLTGQIRPCTFVRMQLAANLRRSDPESAWESRIYPVDWDCWMLRHCGNACNVRLRHHGGRMPRSHCFGQFWDRFFEDVSSYFVPGVCWFPWVFHDWFQDNSPFHSVVSIGAGGFRMFLASKEPTDERLWRLLWGFCVKR